MHLFHISECSIQNRNVHISVLSGAFWDMKQVHSGICELDQLHPWFSVEYNYSPIPKLIVGLAISPLKLGHGWSNYITQKIMNVITYPCPNPSLMVIISSFSSISPIPAEPGRRPFRPRVLGARGSPDLRPREVWTRTCQESSQDGLDALWTRTS